MKRRIPVLLLLLAGLAASAGAQDRPSPAGTWKWTVEFNGQSREQTLTLKLDGEQLTGFLLGRDDRQIAIEEASFRNGVVTFKVTRERNGQKFTSRYTGTLNGDVITGKTESSFGGENRSREWQARRG